MGLPARRQLAPRRRSAAAERAASTFSLRWASRLTASDSCPLSMLDSMPRAPAAKSSAVAPAPAAAPPAWQTLATVLIIVHLFFLAVGLATNVAGGKSLLAPALYRIPLAQRYLKLLWMNVGYDFYLASPLPEDGTTRLQLSAHTSAPEAEVDGLPAEIPAAHVWPRIRRQRYQQLVYHVAFLDELYAENSDVRTTLPLAIAETWLRELDAPHEPYVLTCVREPVKRLPKAVERAPSKPREGGPRSAGPAEYHAETITINLVWDPETASYQGSRAEPEGQTSEVVTAAASSGEVVATPGSPATGLPPIPPSRDVADSALEDSE